MTPILNPLFRGLFSNSIAPVTDAPVAISAAVLPNGTTLRVVFSHPILAGTATLGVSRSVGSITSGVVSNGMVDLTIPKMYHGENAGTISFNAGVGNLAGEGGAVPSFSNLTVENLATETDYLIGGSSFLIDNNGNRLVWAKPL